MIKEKILKLWYRARHFRRNYIFKHLYKFAEIADFDDHLTILNDGREINLSVFVTFYKNYYFKNNYPQL